MVDIKVDGLAELQKALETLSDKIERNVIRSALRSGLKVMKTEAEARVPVRSGKLKASFRIRTRMVKGAPVAALSSGDKKVFYSNMVEFGTKPHDITSKNGKPLAIGGGKPVYKVHHPGAKAKPFMRPAFDAGSRRSVEEFAAYVRKRLTKMGVEIPDEGDQ